MSHELALTDEDLEKIKELNERNSQDRTLDPEYEQVGDFEYLDVFNGARAEYRIESRNHVFEIKASKVDLIGLSNLLEGYLELQNFDEAYNNQYSTNNCKAREIQPVLEETEEDLHPVAAENELSDLAEELRPA